VRIGRKLRRLTLSILIPIVKWLTEDKIKPVKFKRHPKYFDDYSDFTEEQIRTHKLLRQVMRMKLGIKPGKIIYVEGWGWL